MRDPGSCGSFQYTFGDGTRSQTAHVEARRADASLAQELIVASHFLRERYRRARVLVDHAADVQEIVEAARLAKGELGLHDGEHHAILSHEAILLEPARTQIF